MAEKSIMSVENTWLLRILTCMASFISVLLMVLLNMVSNKLDKLDDSVGSLNTRVGQHDTWISTLNNRENMMENNFYKLIGDNLPSGQKLYALKPDDIRVKRNNSDNN